MSVFGVKMPSSIRDYQPVLSLLSKARMSSITRVFGLQNDMQLYGFNLWVQNASASIYPLMQQLEIVLRNSIDSAAKRRFGNYWWRQIDKDLGKDNAKKFIECINKAEKKLRNDFKKREAERRGVDVSIIEEPTIAHDDIIAATDFFAWESILYDAYHADSVAQNNDFLWPISLTKSFRRLHLIDRRPIEARRKLVNLINEVREYRNRLFHHDCIWVKSKTTDRRTAIDSIREKINLIELLIESISPSTHKALMVWGVFAHARRVCSISELNMYVLPVNSYRPNQIEAPIIQSYLTMTNNGLDSLPIEFGQKMCVFYQMR